MVSSAANTVNSPWPEQLAVRVARCYYELGMTQQEIAAELAIGRARVIRLLAEARERGVVTIRIDSPLLESVKLGEELVDRYDLRTADVCLSHAGDELTLARQLGAAAGPVLHRLLEDGMTIGLGWGVTLKELVRQFQPRSYRDMSVVSLLGSLTRRSSVTRFEATTDLAAHIDAECHYLPAPIVCDSEDTRQLLTAQPLFQDIHRLALASDLAVVSIGGLDSGTIRAVDLISDADFDSVSGQGAIGNFLGYYIDHDAAVLDHPLNRRIIGIAGDDFRPIPRRLMVSAGPNKVDALRAVLSNRLVTDLVTDEATARALLAR